MSDELKEEARAKVLQYLNFEKLETNKFEFKRQWYDLRDIEGKSNFFKHAAGIANSPGGDDAFLVFGVAEEKTLHESKIEDSGYSDQASIQDLIETNIDRPFRINIDYIKVNETQLCAMHIEPSNHKPHIVLEYKERIGKKAETKSTKEELVRTSKNLIFTKSGSRIIIANITDLDRMYMERTTIAVFHKAEVSLNLRNFSLSSKFDNPKSNMFYFKRHTTIENLGTRPLSIHRILLFIQRENETLTFYNQTVAGEPLIIYPREIITKEFEFKYHAGEREYNAHVINTMINDLLENTTRKVATCYLTLASGETIPSTLNLPIISQNDKTVGQNPYDFHFA